jgi:hypothetical protein
MRRLALHVELTRRSASAFSGFASGVAVRHARGLPAHGGGPDCGPCPSDDHGRPGRDLPPSGLQRIAVRRDAGPPSERPRTVAESNSLHAIYNAIPPGTSNLRSRQNRAPALPAGRGPLAVVGAGQS